MPLGHIGTGGTRRGVRSKRGVVINSNEIQTIVAATLQRTIQSLIARAMWVTPAGRQRSSPMYEVDVWNAYLEQRKTIKGSTAHDALSKAKTQLERWADQELKRRVARATNEARDEAAEAEENAAEAVEAVRTILQATLAVDDRIDWDALVDRRPLPAAPEITPPRFDPVPHRPNRSFLQWIVPSLWRKRLAFWDDECQKVAAANRAREQDYASTVQRVQQEYAANCSAFLEHQRTQNESVAKFRKCFESGERGAIEEYIRAVFERSVYPDSFNREYAVNFDPASKTAVVDVALPIQDALPIVTAVKFDAKTNQLRETRMKPKEHAELYDAAIKQCVLRTVHEVFEAVYTEHLTAVVVNGWVTFVDGATGNEQTRCVISLRAQRDQFLKLNLARIDPSACIKSLRAVVGGSLSELASVNPILRFIANDGLFVASREVLERIE